MRIGTRIPKLFSKRMDFVVEVGQHQAGTGSSKAACQPSANAAGSAGNQYNLACHREQGGGCKVAKKVTAGSGGCGRCHKKELK